LRARILRDEIALIVLSSRAQNGGFISVLNAFNDRGLKAEEQGEREKREKGSFLH